MFLFRFPDTFRLLYSGHPETDQWWGNFSQATRWKAWRQDWATSNAHIKATEVTPFIYAVVSLGMNYICSFRVLMLGTSPLPSATILYILLLVVCHWTSHLLRKPWRSHRLQMFSCFLPILLHLWRWLQVYDWKYILLKNLMCIYSSFDHLGEHCWKL